MNCQLKSLEHASSDLLWGQTLLRVLKKKAFHARRAILSRAAGLVKRLRSRKDKPPARRDGPQLFTPLGLKPGEKVRVKAYEDIAAMLDDQNKLQGLAFTPAQRRYCGGTFTVLKRLNNVFDERRWKMFQIRHTVLLENAFCDGNGGSGKEWNGCDRHCLLWWKEAWLERVEE